MEVQKLTAFRQNNETNFSMSEMSQSDKESILNVCKIHLSDLKNSDRLDALACLRILSRDHSIQKRLAEPEFFHLLIQEAALVKSSGNDDNNHDVDLEQCKDSVTDSVIEAIKCLSNVVFQNPDVIDQLRSDNCLEILMGRCHSQITQERPHSGVMIFDLKVLFLCSAMNPAARLFLLNTYFASDIFFDMLKWAVESELPEITIELLKILFNLGYAKKELMYSQSAYEATFRMLTSVVRILLIKSYLRPEKNMEVLSHAVNFLTSLPSNCYAGLLVEPPAEGIASKQDAEAHENPKVTAALSVLLEFLYHQLDQTDANPAQSSQFLTPILTVIATGSKYNRVIRKYFRMKILPHLGSDVLRLPESGTTVRNRLCQRLTVKDKLGDDVTEMVAWLLFVLCKENVDRAVKYTGFGNFIGFLSRHGIIETSVSSSAKDGDYSSSSDSETEEYRDLKAQINPVTGRVEPPPNRAFTEGMSEEQKEFEVMQLVNKLDQISRTGVFQPGVVEGGRVRPVEHVLELLKDIKDNDDSSERDSD